MSRHRHAARSELVAFNLNFHVGMKEEGRIIGKMIPGKRIRRTVMNSCYTINVLKFSLNSWGSQNYGHP